MAWARITFSECTAPLRDRAALLQLFAFPFLLYIIFLAQGFQGVTGELFQSWAALKAILFAIPLFILWNMVAACFKVRQEEQKRGQWFGGHFVYNSPQLLKTVRVTNKNNGEIYPIKIKQAEIGGYVYVHTKIEGFEQRRIKAQLFPGNQESNIYIDPLDWGICTYGSAQYAIYVGSKKTIYLTANCETSNWSIIRVYLDSFSLR